MCPFPRTTESRYAIDFPKSTSNLFLLYTYTNKLSPLSHKNSHKDFPRVSNKLKTTKCSSQPRCACLTATHTLLPQLISSHLNSTHLDVFLFLAEETKPPPLLILQTPTRLSTNTNANAHPGTLIPLSTCTLPRQAT